MPHFYKKNTVNLPPSENLATLDLCLHIRNLIFLAHRHAVVKVWELKSYFGYHGFKHKHRHRHTNERNTVVLDPSLPTSRTTNLSLTVNVIMSPEIIQRTHHLPGKLPSFSGKRDSVMREPSVAYRLHFSCEHTGKYVASSKRRITW